MNVTIKGQVTIPQVLRERYGLLPGTEVEFVPDGDVLRLRPREVGEATRTAFDAWAESAAGCAEKGLTTDDVMAITRGED